MANIHLKGYFKPTPVNIRKAADSMLLFALFLQTQPDIFGADNSRYIMIAVGFLKMVSNFFTVTPDEPQG